MLREKGKLSPRISIITERNYITTEGIGMLFCIFGISGTAGWLAGRPGGCLQAWAYCMYGSGRDRALKFLLSGLSEGIRSRSSAVISDGGSFRPGAIATQFSGTGRQFRPKVDRRGRFCDAECRGYVPYLQMCVCYDRLGNGKRRSGIMSWRRGAGRGRRHAS